MRLLWWRRTLLGMEMDLFLSGDKQIENTLSNFSHTHMASYCISNFQTDLMSRRLLLTITHFQKWAVSHSYLPPITLYTIVFSAELCGLQVDQVHTENDKQSSTHTQLVPSKLFAPCNTCGLVRCGQTTCATPTHLLNGKPYNFRPRLQTLFETVLRP